jgi:hypothetical protein
MKRTAIPRRTWLPLVLPGQRQRLPSSPEPQPAPGGLSWLWQGGILILLATALLFNHGCHGDDIDDEPIFPYLQENRSNHRDTERTEKTTKVAQLSRIDPDSSDYLLTPSSESSPTLPRRLKYPE